MPRVILEGELQERLKGLTGKVELLDQGGRLVGVFDPTAEAGAVRLACPFTEEELQERAKTRTGRDISEVLKTLEAL